MNDYGVWNGIISLGYTQRLDKQQQPQEAERGKPNNRVYASILPFMRDAMSRDQYTSKTGDTKNVRGFCLLSKTKERSSN